MIFSRAFLFLAPCSALVAASTMSGPTTNSNPPTTEFANRFAWVYYAPATPLDQIPVYSLASSAPQAVKALEAEIERLYTHSKSMPLGHERRAFQTRIYLLEKQLRPISQSFDAAAWETLRAAVRLEWETIRTGLVPAPAAPAQPARADGESLAAVEAAS